MMNQITKIILKIILKRIKGKIKQEVAEEQRGFMEGKSTNNAIFMLRVLAERVMEKQKDLYVCFIDYEKAFDKVKHAEIIEDLVNIGVGRKEIQMIKNLYWTQKACVRINGEETEYQEIKRGLRQGCVLSPDLFSLHSEMIMRNIQELEGVRIGGQNISNLRYADDTVLIADSNEKLQIIFDRVNEESENKGLKINIRKTKCMVITKKDPAPRIELRCGNQTIETVTSFNYLGSMITTDARSETEIKRRIGIAKNAFRHMQKLLTNRKLSIKTRKGLIKTHIWSTLLYGAESWTLSTGMRRRLEAMELWLWRRMMKIPWTARKTNEEVLRMVGEKRNLMIDIRKRQLKFFGHIMRREGLENTIITGMVEGKRGRGRPRIKYIDGLIALTRGNMTAAQFLRTTKERGEWKSMVADVLEDMAQR